MPSCECCWMEASRKCECTQDTKEGAKARAGQFWVDGKDTRLDV